MEKYLIIIGIVLFVILILFFANYFSKGKRKGREAEKKTYRYLKKISKGKKWKIINNAYLPLYNKTCEIDHILIGNFGVCVIETKGISGTVSGTGEVLMHTIGSQKHQFYNPQKQNKTHKDNVIHHLKKGKFDIPVHSVVVFTADDIELKTPVGIYLKDLEKEIRRFVNVNCDVEKVYEYLNSIQVRNPIKKLLHSLSM